MYNMSEVEFNKRLSFLGDYREYAKDLPFFVPIGSSKLGPFIGRSKHVHGTIIHPYMEEMGSAFPFFREEIYVIVAILVAEMHHRGLHPTHADITVDYGLFHYLYGGFFETYTAIYPGGIMGRAFKASLSEHPSKTVSRTRQVQMNHEMRRNIGYAEAVYVSATDSRKLRQKPLDQSRYAFGNNGNVLVLGHAVQWVNAHTYKDGTLGHDIVIRVSGLGEKENVRMEALAGAVINQIAAAKWTSSRSMGTSYTRRMDKLAHNAVFRSVSADVPELNDFAKSIIWQTDPQETLTAVQKWRELKFKHHISDRELFDNTWYVTGLVNSWNGSHRDISPDNLWTDDRSKASAEKMLETARKMAEELLETHRLHQN